MAFHKLILHSLPQIQFAHGFRTEAYQHRFEPCENLTEITLIQRGELQKQYPDGRTEVIPAPSLYVNFFRDAFSVSRMGKPHGHVTVAFAADCTLLPVEEAELRKAHGALRGGGAPYALLPDWMPLDAGDAELERRIAGLIGEHMVPFERRLLGETGRLLDLLAEITERVRRAAMRGSSITGRSGSLVYVERAILYMTAHLGERFSLPELVEHLGISAGYLSRLFQEATGQSAVEYVNRLKIERVRELIRSRGVTLREAGESVGIDDPNYLSRLFKKVCGVSVRAFRRMDIRL